MIKHGFKQSASKKWPTNLSNRRVVLLGDVQSILYLRHYLFKNSLAS